MESNKEYTYIMLKPDGVEKNILEEVIKRFINEGLEVAELKKMDLTEEVLREHYAHVVDRPFYPPMEKYMLSGPVVAMIVLGLNAVAKTRELIGATKNAEPGTIRGDYADKIMEHKNVIHGSDSIENAKIEIARFFGYLDIECLEPMQHIKKPINISNL